MTGAELNSYLVDVSGSTFSVKDTAIITRISVEAMDKLYKIRPWNVYKDWARVNCSPPHTSGTVTIASGTRTTVTGSSTSFVAAMAGCLFRGANAGPVHRIYSYNSATSLTLQSQFQTLDATTLSSGSAYTIYYDSYDISTMTGFNEGKSSLTRTVEKVVLASTGLPLQHVSNADMVRMWGELPMSGEPEFYTVVSGQDTATNAETIRIRLYPAPSDTYSLDILRNRYPDRTVSLSSTSEEVDIPPYLEGLYKAICLRRFAMYDRRWRDLLPAANADYVDEMEHAIKMDGRNAPALRYDGYSGIARNRNWDWRVTTQ